MRLGITTTLIASFALAGCPAPKSETDKGEETKQAKKTETPSPTAATPLAAVQAFVKAVKKRKTDKAKAMLDASATWRAAGSDEVRKGPDAIGEEIEARRTALRLRMNANDYFVLGDVIVMSGAWIGKHMGEFGGVAATNEGVGYEGAMLFRTKDGRITEIIEYFDASAPYAQVGAIPKEKVWAQRDNLSVVVQPNATIHEGEGPEAALAFIDELHAALVESKDPAAPENAAEVFAYWESSTASALTGGEITARFTELRAAIPDLNIEVEEKWVVEDVVVARTRWKGTHTNALGSWPAKGKALDIESLEVIRLEEGKIGSWTVHFNGHAVLRAMEVVDALPG